MRIKAEQLSSHLGQKGLAPIYCVSGDEPLQMLECADQIRTYARKNKFEERIILNVDKGFEWNRLNDAGSNMSLFSNKRLIELRLDNQKPGTEGSTALIEYADTLVPDNVLLITMARIDRQGQQTKWYKALDKAGITIQIWPVEAGRLPAWITNRARQLGKRISGEAAGLISDRVEGNLLAARQELEKLCLQVETPEIGIRDVMDAISDSARFDVFSLIEFTMAGKPDRVLRMIRGLKSEDIEPINVFGALIWEIRRICSMAYAIRQGETREKVFAEFHIWPQRKAAVNAVLNRMNHIALGNLLRQAMFLDRVLKGAVRAEPWELLENFLFQIAGVGLQSGPNDTSSLYYSD